jgi:NAD-dependent DNA ligase
MEKPLSQSDIAQLITRRRNQILVHSCLYYRLNDSVIPDYTFDLWSKELADLQTQFPHIAEQCDYHKEFEKFDGSSGFDLPIHDPRVIGQAVFVKRIAEKFN